MPPEQPYATEYRFPAAKRESGTGPAVPRWAIIGVFLMMLFYFVTAAAAFLMPVTLGILLFFVFVPFRRLMSRLGFGASVAAAVVTLGMVALVMVLGYFISGPISGIVEDSDQISGRLEERLRDLRESASRPGMFDGVVRTFDTFKSEVDTASLPASDVPELKDQ